jgi:hypothetical protein
MISPPTIVAQVNDDNLTVPTVLLRDDDCDAIVGEGSDNPSAAQVGSRLVQVSDSTYPG